MGLPGCVTCHENHEIVPPTDAFLSTGKEGKCSVVPRRRARRERVPPRQCTRTSSTLQKATEAAKRRASTRGRGRDGGRSRTQFDLVARRRGAHEGAGRRPPIPAVRRPAAASEGLTIARTARAEAARIRREREFRRKGLVVFPRAHRASQSRPSLRRFATSTAGAAVSGSSVWRLYRKSRKPPVLPPAPSLVLQFQVGGGDPEVFLHHERQQ